MRALRADKLTYAALEATLALWVATAPARMQIPVVRMLTMTPDEIDRRARVSSRTELSGVAGSRVPRRRRRLHDRRRQRAGSRCRRACSPCQVEGCQRSALEARLRGS